MSTLSAELVPQPIFLATPGAENQKFFPAFPTEFSGSQILRVTLRAFDLLRFHTQFGPRSQAIILTITPEGNTEQIQCQFLRTFQRL